ncbi:hypothetical protein [Streptomyces specialis]|uniref:hypothetical protein n=1 Tax=Streptomyces specialis TaxID=498367 RepID=UPI00073F533E|nr:hypothetical protein [Streptomyces specialis]
MAVALSRSLALALCAGAVTLATAAGAGPALAEDGTAGTTAGPTPGATEPADPAGGVEIQGEPAGPRPGDDIELRVPGCSGESGTARSAGFVAEARLTRPADGGTGLFGEARVSSTAAPGEHPIEVACDGEEITITGRLVVAGADSGVREPGAPTEYASPTAPVRAGGGGTAPEPEGAARSMSGGTAGLALFSGALAGGAVLAVWRLHARET